MDIEDKEYTLLKKMINDIHGMPEENIKAYVKTMGKYIDRVTERKPESSQKSKKIQYKKPLDILSDNLDTLNIKNKRKKSYSKDEVSDLKKLKL